MKKKDSIHELMLSITNDMSEKLPKIDQNKFDEIVNDAICSDDSLEKVWRIAMTYDEYGFNYDIIDKFFIDSKDTYYLSEYISVVLQINQEKIVNMMIEQGDKNLINEFLNKYIGVSGLQEKYVNILKEYIKKK